MKLPGGAAALSADPEVAYRGARGLPVIHPYNRTRVQIRTPLDFLVVSDHAEFLGEGGKRERRRVLLNPAPQIFDSRVVGHPRGDAGRAGYGDNHASTCSNCVRVAPGDGLTCQP